MKAKKSTTKHVLPKKSHMGKKPGKKIAISFTVLAGRAMEASTYVTCEQQYYTHMNGFFRKAAYAWARVFYHHQYF